MKIDISSMTQQPGSQLQVSYDGSAAGFESVNTQTRFTGTLHLDGILRHIEHGMFKFDGHVTVPYHAECDRCLTEIDRVLEADIHEVFVSEHSGLISRTRYQDAYEAEDADDSYEEEEEEYFSYPGQMIDLTEAVSQNLILAQPSQILCREDCRGLCPNCGQNWNEGSCSCRDEAEGEDTSPFADLKKLL